MKLTIAELAAMGSGELGHSRWLKVEQSDIDGFARVTHDHSWIHVDPLKAQRGPYGQTVAHGYLSLSLLPTLLADVLTVVDMRGRINYGIDRLRFISPVLNGSEVCAQAHLLEATYRDQGLLYRLKAELQIKGTDRPALVGELLFLVF
jgi:acyl dehydratase